MDMLAALRLQIEWGADEALQDTPIDRFNTAPPPSLSQGGEGGGSEPPAETRPAPAKPRIVAPAPLPTLAAATLATQAAAAADSLAALHAAIDGFHACPLRATAATTVAPSGNPGAGIVLIAEAPGPEDDRSGQAFSGPPGQTLDRILASAGLSRAQMLLAMLVPWRPPGGRPPNDTELATCLPFLHRLLVLTRPRRLVLVGTAPLRLLTGQPGTLRRLRGKVLDTTIPGLGAPIPALPMLPPETWLSTPANKQAVWTDLLTLAATLHPITENKPPIP